MTLPEDPRADPFIDREPKVSGSRFAHLFARVKTFREIDEVWRTIEMSDREGTAAAALEAALDRSRALRAEGADITPSSDEVWEEWGLPQNDVELTALIEWCLDAPFSMPPEMSAAIGHHAKLRRGQLLAAGVVTGPSPF